MVDTVALTHFAAAVPEASRKDLNKAPISPDGLFGPQFHKPKASVIILASSLFLWSTVGPLWAYQQRHRQPRLIPLLLWFPSFNVSRAASSWSNPPQEAEQKAVMVWGGCFHVEDRKEHASYKITVCPWFYWPSATVTHVIHTVWASSKAQHKLSLALQSELQELLMKNGISRVSQGKEQGFTLTISWFWLRWGNESLIVT